ncbi:class I SAM-dependent methyltransferase [Candidatus Neomarinimicrobiota bacterium]
MTKLNSDEFKLPVYRDAVRYDAEHWWKVDDFQFWTGMSDEYGPNILELACGTGRLALELMKTPAKYTGLDISEEFLAAARIKLEEYGERCRFTQGDIREFNLVETFDLIFIGFNSFLHLLTDEDARLALDAVRKHCHKDTRFIIDIFVPDSLVLYRPGDLRIPAMTFSDPIDGQPVEVEETNEFDPATELNHIRWFYSSPDEKDFLQYDFNMRMYYPDTMDRLLHDSGFAITHKWGDYEGASLDIESALQIYVAQANL